MTPTCPPSTPRDRLLCAAMELFTSRGYAATSVRELVEHAGVTKPVLYYHFHSKEGIYLEILRSVERLLDDALVRLSADTGGARERLERLLLGLFELFEENTAAVRFLNAVFWGPAQGAPPFDCEALHRRLRDAVGEMVANGVAEGELRGANPEEVALVFIGLFSFSMDLQLAHPDLGLGKAGLGRLLDLVFAGLAVPKPTI